MVSIPWNPGCSLFISVHIVSLVTAFRRHVTTVRLLLFGYSTCLTFLDLLRNVGGVTLTLLVASLVVSGTPQPFVILRRCMG